MGKLDKKCHCGCGEYLELSGFQEDYYILHCPAGCVSVSYFVRSNAFEWSNLRVKLAEDDWNKLLPTGASQGFSFGSDYFYDSHRAFAEIEKDGAGGYQQTICLYGEISCCDADIENIYSIEAVLDYLDGLRNLMLFR
jgi:hypothetical protein